MSISNRILLIEPPFYRLYKKTYSLNRYPLSLGYLAGTIKKETDWDVVVYNADFSPESETGSVSYLAGDGFKNYLNNLKDFSGAVWSEIRAAILAYSPTVVGITAKSQNFASAQMVAQIAKEINKEIIVVVGGPHPSMAGKDVFDCKAIDISVRGEGEKTIIELLNAVGISKALEKINGIIFRKNGEVTETPPREFITDLDTLCFPHETVSQVLKNSDLYPLTAFKNVFAIRGCPFNCFYCGSRNIWSRKARFRSPENIVEEIKGLQKMGLKSIHFDDDTFGINQKYIQDLCNALISHCPGIKWSCEIHVRLANDKNISMMKKAGCYSIQIGIESGSNEILQEMRKNITIEEALSACKIIKKYGIELQAFFMVGFPQETEETLNETIKAIEKIDCDVLIYSIFTPYPGTEAFEFCRSKGLIPESYNVSLYNHQSPLNCFCMHIQPERFRMLVSKIERIVDRRNARNRVKRIFSRNTLWRIQELGAGKSLKRGIRLLFGK